MIDIHSHILPGLDDGSKSLEESVEMLRQAAAGDAPRIHYGCDFHLTLENIDDALRSPEKYSIDHRGYLLVEFSDFLIPKTTSEIFARLIGAGLRPIVTHPER